MLFSPVFAKLQQRPGHQPALTRPDLLSVRLIQGISFQSITHSFARRPTAIPFPFNHFHTLFIVTEGVPSCLSDFAQFWCNLSPFRINTSRPPRKCCKQKTYSLPKLFRCNTYKKPGVGSTILGPADVGRSPTGECLALPFDSGAKLKLRTRLVPNRDQEGRVIHW